VAYSVSDVEAAGPAHHYVVRTDGDPRIISRLVNERPREFAATSFQTSLWLATWYNTLGRGGGEPIVLTVVDGRTREVAAILPLFRRRERGLRVIDFADGGVSDYNAAILGPAAPTGVGLAKAFWTATKNVLSDADLIRFTKMPGTVEGRINPLVLLPQAARCSLNSNTIYIPRTWESFLAGLDRKVRKEIGRSWRVFSGHDGAEFRRVEALNEAEYVLSCIERQQRARFARPDSVYLLDHPDIIAFYRELVAGGLRAGEVVLTALLCHNDVVAALLGLVRGRTYTMIRISKVGEPWTNCSPGRLVIIKTMRLLLEQGCTTFDLSIGDLPYKRRLGTQQGPLFELAVALTARGLPSLAYQRTKQLIGEYPVVDRFARRVLHQVRRA
jgi:CelD/BcsL family acetyltransferase involved in cellulose biosynthesis